MADVERTPIHDRTLQCRGFRRADGLWDIEGELTDVKHHDVPSRIDDRVFAAGEPVHRMRVRLTVDDDLVLRAIAVKTLRAPFPPCGAVDGDYAALIGQPLGKGFVKALRGRFGGVGGCAHVVELIATLATVAFQTVYPVLSRERPEAARPNVIDSCNALAADGVVVARAWPAWARRGEAA